MKAWRTIGFAGLALLALAALSVAMQADFPGPTGSYVVGRTTLRWVDNRDQALKGQSSNLLAKPSQDAEVLLEVYEPK